MPIQPVPVFQYYDGAADVFADPWPIHCAMMLLTGGRPNDLIRKVRAVKADSDDQTVVDGAQAMIDLEAQVREMFKMKDFNPATGEGAQWPHCLAVWEKFAIFLSDAKKKTATPPTSISPSDSPADSSQATPNGSA